MKNIPSPAIMDARYDLTYFLVWLFVEFFCATAVGATSSGGFTKNAQQERLVPTTLVYKTSL